MKNYSIIYADPPWRYKVYSKKGLGRSAESHYPTMELEDIRALPVGTLAADDCVLFLWTTIPLLHDCFSVMRAWGFSYKTVAFVWIKQNRKSDSLFWGMGHWTRANAEFCMLATKGHPKRRSTGVHQVILSHIEEHSKKPEEARRRIVELMGDLPRIELFARQKADGWDVWGNEVDCDIEIEGYRKFCCRITGSYKTLKTPLKLGTANLPRYGSLSPNHPHSLRAAQFGM